MHRFPQLPSTLPVMPDSLAQQGLLKDFATRYIWWKPLSEALHFPERILAQVMNLGTYEDLGRLLSAFTVEELRYVLERAEPGWFNERSWVFWHLRLGCLPVNGTPPPLPIRALPD